MSLGIVLCPRHCGGTLGCTLGFVTELPKPWGEVWEASVVPSVMSRLSHHLPLSSCLDEAHSTEINCFIRVVCVQAVAGSGDAEVGSGCCTPSWVGTISVGTVVALAEMAPWFPATALQIPVPPVTALSSLCRWQQSAKSSGLASNLQPSGAKADALREEMEEAANRVEICRVPGAAACWAGETFVSRGLQKT